MLNKRNILLLIAAASIFIVLAFVTIFSISRLNKVSQLLEENKSLLLTETAKNREAVDYLNNINSMIAYDLNRTRVSLGLPAGEYPIKDLTGEVKQEDTVESDTELVDAVSVLLEAELTNKKSALIGSFLHNEILSAYLDNEKIFPVKLTNVDYDLHYNGKSLAQLSAESETVITINGLNGESLNTASASNESIYFISKNLELRKQLDHKTESAIEALSALHNDGDVLKAAHREETLLSVAMDDNNLIISNKINDNSIVVKYVNSDNEIVFSLSTLTDYFNTAESLKSALISEMGKIDLREDEMVMLDNVREAFETRINDKSFHEYLNGIGLEINTTAREDLDYYYYDLKYINGVNLGSFSILKKLGEIYLVDADEVPVSSLKTLAVKKDLVNDSGRKFLVPENIPQIEGLYSNKNSITFLLVGNHEKNTDTMILVHADKTTGKAYMIGIPRDLYWKGRKINSIYLYYGAEQFKKELSEITGLEISNYIIVDMYAFIDIVNILGGIEVTLEEDLVDPTYRTRENGIWSTLNYQKGTYNLNGVEALRVARSRHSTNDFERSKRQQQILEAFLNKIKKLSLTDIDKVYGMIQAIFQYVDTDFSFIEIMNIFNDFKDSELAGKHVLSFDNILYDTYSNTYMLDDDVELDDNFNKGAWILFPRDNDWNNIRWYIRGIINGEIK